MPKQSKSIQTYYSSDFHFGLSGIIDFERHNFTSIQEHDEYLINMITKWSEQWAAGSTFWFLGDWGDTSYLWTLEPLIKNGIICNMIYGNHDHLEDKALFEQYFDSVYEYPIFISQKLVLSHLPIAVYDDTINIHGHLHGAKLRDSNHINASIHVADYKPIGDKQISATFGKLPKYTRRFLYEPFAEDYQFIQSKPDVIMDYNGNIDLSASRLLQKLNKDARVAAGDCSYVPYTGGV